MDELDLGLAPAPPEKPKPKPDPSKIRWSSYRPQKPVHCDRCLAIRHAGWPGINSAPNRATFKRTQGDEVTYWCSIHADEYGGRYQVRK